jgi:hypothetical protein
VRLKAAVGRLKPAVAAVGRLKAQGSRDKALVKSGACM